MRLLRNPPKKPLIQFFYILKASLLLNYLPTCWKTAIIIPILKPGKDKSLSASYRPVSLLSILDKILEKVILHEIKKHVSCNNIIINEQFGFRSNHSTILQLMRVVDTIANEHNRKRLSAMVLLDLNKSFDSVWHDGLLLKLSNQNFPAHILSIISSFLKNRFLTVKINKTYSQLKSIPAGVPKS